MKRIFFCLVVLLVMSCNKADISDIPRMPVYLELDLQFKDKDLVGTYHYKEITSVSGQNYGTRLGYSGVLVVNGFDSNNKETYHAYELCCPHEAKKDITVKADDTGVAQCPECGTKYDIAYGSGAPLNGPSKYPLRKFDVTQRGSELLIQY
jgi:nitrite reductase/ring-hydroxylating ferredoxin subunit